MSFISPYRDDAELLAPDAVEQVTPEQNFWGFPPIPGTTPPSERALLLTEIRAGRKDENELTNIVFFLRHPSRKGTRIGADEQALKAEWLSIRSQLVAPALLSGPEIGPVHTGTPPGADLRKGVPADAKLSPLAITLRGLRRAPHRQPATIAAIVVHTTSRGPADRARKGGYNQPAIHYALNYYVSGNGGFPHYVVDFNGTIYATCDERLVAHHAGWVHQGGAKHFTGGWTAPQWWSRVWTPLGVNSPLQLLAKGARSPNQRTIGIELLMLPDLTYTAEQYRALARLVVDIQARNSDVQIASAPSRTLLGHEDFAPVTGAGGRANADGGWDPGAHRAAPWFSWQRLWTEIQAVKPGFGAPAASPTPAGPVPELSGEAPWEIGELDEQELGIPFRVAGHERFDHEDHVPHSDGDASGPHAELAASLLFHARHPELAAGGELAGEEQLVDDWRHVRTLVDEIVAGGGSI